MASSAWTANQGVDLISVSRLRNELSAMIVGDSWRKIFAFHKPDLNFLHKQCAAQVADKDFLHCHHDHVYLVLDV